MIFIIIVRKFKQEQTLYKNVTLNNTSISENPNREMDLKEAQLIQFSMSQSTWIIVLHHIGCIRDDCFGSFKKICPGTNLTSKCFTFWGK